MITLAVLLFIMWQLNDWQNMVPSGSFTHLLNSCNSWWVFPAVKWWSNHGYVNVYQRVSPIRSHSIPLSHHEITINYHKITINYHKITIHHLSQHGRWIRYPLRYPSPTVPWLCHGSDDAVPLDLSGAQVGLMESLKRKRPGLRP